MCGRYTITASLQDVQKAFGIKHTRLTDWHPRFNVAPGQMIPIIYSDKNKFILDEMVWGLIPSWSKSQKTEYKMINLRSENVLVKPYFRRLLQKQRCIVPVDGFYEWKKEGKDKQPMRIVMKDQSLFALAGLWDLWESELGEQILSCSILTSNPNSLLKQIHHRMPVMLDQTQSAQWLDEAQFELSKLKAFFKPISGEVLDAYSVSKQVNKATFDDPECIKQITNK